MELNKALNLIKKNLNNKIVETKHFKEKCEDRNLKFLNIKKIIVENKILEIVEQNENLYKLWYHYEKNKDLNIVIKILPLNKIKLITIFPCYSDRRTR